MHINKKKIHMIYTLKTSLYAVIADLSFPDERYKFANAILIFADRCLAGIDCKVCIA